MIALPEDRRYRKRPRIQSAGAPDLPICSPVRSTAVAVDDAPKEQYVAPETGPWGLSSFLAGFLAIGPQTVTCPPNRVDDGLTELAAQVPHVHVDEVRPGIEVHAPGHGQ